MRISEDAWLDYIRKLRQISDEAANLFTRYLQNHDAASKTGRQAAIDYAYALATRYGEGAAALACEMYDAVAAVSDASVPAAEPAATPTYSDVAKTVNGTLKQSSAPELPGQAVGRLVKRTGVDTTMQNAIRDGAEWAWIPHGDTCAFCMMLASRGWQRASKKALKGGHAEHIHANCDCTYAIRFDRSTRYSGYDPDKYLAAYNDAEGRTWEEKINALRRENYAQDGDRIREQKRIAYHRQLVQGSDTKRKPVDVTAEYVASATPGIGKITYDRGYDMGRQHANERAFAEWIVDNLGGDVQLLSETGASRSDYLWRGRMWELKNPRTENAADQAVRKGLKQILENSGGLFLDYRDSDVNLDQVMQIVTNRMRFSGKRRVDVLIVQRGQIVRAFRYEKEAPPLQ